MRMTKAKEQFMAICRASVLAILLFTSFYYFFLSKYHYSRMTLVIFVFLNIGALFVFKLIILALLRNFRRRGYNLKHVLIVGSGDLARSVAEKLLLHLEFGYRVMGFLARTQKEVGKSIINDIKVIGTYNDLMTLAKEKGLDQVIFCLDSREERLIRPLLGLIDNEGVDLKVILELGNIFTLRDRAEDIDGLTVLLLRESPLFGWQAIAKRVLDLSGSLFGLIVLAPLMGLIALGIKLTSQGPVFYSQERMGMDGKKFTLYKFRSMVKDAELGSGAVFAKKGDRRVTRIGKVLRRFCLDELPQLINVLKGDLSLVGPRPEGPEFVSEFYKSVPKYMLRHKIRMGMTGWAQVNGLRGESCIKTRVEYDLYYIEHWSLWFDLKILFLTFFAVPLGKGSC
jgi:Undecaprenyl-phosphate glucose phosphotransferase